MCLQEATHNYNALFGGKALVMLGDFDQLPPVVGSSIPEVAMRMLQEKFSGRNCGQYFRKENNEDDITAVRRRGVKKSVKAKHIKLTRQHWSEDDDHMELLNKMSAGKRITPND